MEGNSSTALPEMMACMLGYEICHEPWAFYYDETENCRLIRYGEQGIADPRTMERDFILGGIALTDPSVYGTLISNCTPSSTIDRRYRTLEKLCNLRLQS